MTLNTVRLHNKHKDVNVCWEKNNIFFPWELQEYHADKSNNVSEL